MSDIQSTLRDLFTRSLALWEREGDDSPYDEIWPLLNEAAALGPAAFDIGMHFLKSPQPGQRAIAADLLGCVAARDPEQRRAVASALVRGLAVEDEYDVAWSMLIAIGPTETPETIPTLCLWATDEDAELRSLAVQSLGMVMAENRHTGDGIDALISAMEDPDDNVGFWATYALGTLVGIDEKNIHTALSKRLFDPNNDIRMEAVVGLARRGDERVVSSIEQALREADVSPRAFDAAIVAANPVLLPALQRANRSEVSDEQYEAAVRACTPT